MNQLIKLVRGSKLVLLFVFVVGVLSVAPTVLAPIAISHEYQGIQFLYLNDETIYRTRIHEVLDGALSISSPFLLEYKNSKSVVPPLNELFYAVPALVLGLSGAIIFAKFVFPSVLFLLIFLLSWFLLRSLSEKTRRATSIAVGLLVVLGYDFVDVGHMKALIIGEPVTHLLIWTRLVNPIVGVLIACSILLLVWKIFTEQKRVFIVPLTLLLAFTVGYFFSFGISYAFVGLLLLIALYRKEFKVVYILATAGIFSVLINVSYWYHSLNLLEGEVGKAMSLKNGMFFTHNPIINKLVAASSVLLILIFLYHRKKRKERIGETAEEWYFIGAMMITCWVVFAQQIITGRAVWPDHFVQFTIPISIISVVTGLALVFAERIPRIWSLGTTFIIIFSVAFGTYSAGSYTHSLPDFRRQQHSYGPMVEWLNQNAAKDCVVLSREWNEELERLIPAYTSCNVYNTQYVYFAVPTERVLHNFIVRMRMLEVDPENVEAYLYADENDVRGYFFENWNQLYMSTQGRDAWLDGKVSMIANAYRTSLSVPLIDLLHKYRIDYVYAKEPLSSKLMIELPDIEVAQKTDVYTLYRIPARIGLKNTPE